MSTTTATRTYALGDLVIADPSAGWPGWTRGVVYQITQVPAGARGVNYVARPKDNPSGRGIRGRGASLLPWTEGEPTQPPVQFIDFKPVPEMGTVVRVSGYPKIDPQALYFVLGPAKRPNCVRLCLVGGDGGRYWIAIAVDRLTIVPPENIVAI